VEFDQLVSLLRGGQSLTSNQQENLLRIIELSRAFHSDAGLYFKDPGSPGKKAIVLESGHQPNFLPYPGVWKKAFLLDRIAGELRDLGEEVIPLFGFADQNLSTASVLYRNHILAFRKNGSCRIGFKLDKSHFTRFDCVDKPSKDRWNQELSSIRDFYGTNSRKLKEDNPELVTRIDAIIDIMDRCYQRAHNFPELNALIFSRVCHDLLGSRILFFFYSDLQREGLFSEEWNRLIDLLEPYTTLYNRVITEKNIGLHPLSKNQLPFWYHCSCNGKVTLELNEEGDAVGTCETCGNPIRLPVKGNGGDLSRWLPWMSLSAVARNIIFSEGLGTKLFISGAGGGLQYGQVATEISRSLRFHTPITLAWISRDYFLGLAQRIGLQELLRTYQISSPDLTGSNLQEKIQNFQDNLRTTIDMLESAGRDPRDVQRCRSRFLNSKIDLEIVQQIFTTMPSMLDILIQFPGQYISQVWETALLDPTLEEQQGMMMIKNDVVYREKHLGFSPEEIPRIYQNITSLEVD